MDLELKSSFIKCKKVFFLKNIWTFSKVDFFVCFTLELESALGSPSIHYFHSYLKGRKQYVKINNTCSDYNKNTSGGQQGSILRLILVNLSMNYLFFFIVIASMHNSADVNTLSSWVETNSKLIDTLQLESNIAISWYWKNITNLDKFQAIIPEWKKSSLTNILL